MADAYFIECDCGTSIQVELYEAGTSKICPSCHSTVRVPNSVTLKKLAGDPYPLLRPIEKIRQTLENREPPFDDVCHVCGGADVECEVPITFDVMTERQVADHGGIRPSIIGGISLHAADAEEHWQTTRFPLMLCNECHTHFESSRSSARRARLVGTLCLLALLIAFVYFAYHNAEIVAALSGLIWLLGAVAWAARFRQCKKLDPFILDWLRHIRWMPEAIADEDEYRLTVGQSKQTGRRGA